MDAALEDVPLPLALTGKVFDSDGEDFRRLDGRCDELSADAGWREITDVVLGCRWGWACDGAW